MAAYADDLLPDDMSELVELRFSCQNLPNLDTMSKSDPIVAVFLKTGAASYVEVGRTEVIQNNLNPEFAKAVTVTYHFEEVQTLSCRVYDVDNESADLGDDDCVGSYEVSLAEVINSRGGAKQGALTHAGASRGTIIVRAEEAVGNNMQALMRLRGFNLDKMDLFSKSDPFLEISRSREDGGYSIVHRTEVIDNTLEPQWAPFELSVQALCNGDWDRVIKFECFDSDGDDKKELIGEFSTCLRELSGGEKRDYELVNPKKRAKKKSYNNSGVINVVSCEVIKTDSFLDYIAGGCEISLMVAVDYTASNGDPSTSTSLHYRDPYGQNEYQKAIHAVGQVCEPYDTDGLFATVGFGARVGGSKATSHCFPLAGPDTWFVRGTEGVLEAYEQSFANGIRLHGPTNFTPVLQYAMEMARQPMSQNDQKYYIVLILTDGEITDLDRTIESLVDGADLPLSVIIVGVGQAQFDNMERLDADDEPLRAGNKIASRDVVQFVAFRDFVNKSPAELAKAVLHEVPKQFMAFMKRANIKPHPPIPPPSFDSAVGVGGSELGPPPGPPPAY